MRAITYSRVSTTFQDTERQELQIRNFCEKENITILASFREKKSGRIIEREELEKMLKAVEEENPDYVIVQELSRLGRNTDVSNTIKSITDLKTNFISIKEGIQTNVKDNFGLQTINLLIGIINSINIFELSTFTSRSKTGLYKSIVNGGVFGSNNFPFGYMKENKKMKINEEEAKYVLYIFNEYLKGKGSLTLANDLNSLGVATRNKKKWRDAVIYGMLKNCIYKGDRKFNDEIIHQENLRLISDEQFQLVNERLHSNYNKAGKHVKHNYLLEPGKIKCGICNKTYYAHKRSNGKDNHYICISTRYQENCGNFGISIDKVEKSAQLMIIKHFSKVLKKKLDNEQLKKAINQVLSDIEALEKKDEGLLKSQTNLLIEKASVLIPEDAYLAAIKRINKERDDNTILLKHAKSNL